MVLPQSPVLSEACENHKTLNHTSHRGHACILPVPYHIRTSCFIWFRILKPLKFHQVCVATAQKRNCLIYALISTHQIFNRRCELLIPINGWRSELTAGSTGANEGVLREQLGGFIGAPDTALLSREAERDNHG